MQEVERAEAGRVVSVVKGPLLRRVESYPLLRVFIGSTRSLIGRMLVEDVGNAFECKSNE